MVLVAAGLGLSLEHADRRSDLGFALHAARILAHWTALSAALALVLLGSP